MTSAIDIRYASSADEARAALADGYEPVECSFGEVSVVGGLELDHHGLLADRPPVCEQALTAMSYPGLDGYLSGRVSWPAGYVVTGPPDADASLAIAVIEATRRREDECHAYIPIVRLVAAQDLGRWTDLTSEGHDGAVILAWHARQRARRPRRSRVSSEGSRLEQWALAVQDWAELLALRADWYHVCQDGWTNLGECPGCSPDRLHVELEDALGSERTRIRVAADAEWTVLTSCSCSDGGLEDQPGSSLLWSDGSRSLSTAYGAPHDGCKLSGWTVAPVAMVESPVMGADVWYGLHPGLRGYVAWQADTQRITVSLRPGTAIGTGLLGCADLVSDGWGGRPEVLGSPRGRVMKQDEAIAITRMLAQRIDDLSTASR